MLSKEQIRELIDKHFHWSKSGLMVDADSFANEAYDLALEKAAKLCDEAESSSGGQDYYTIACGDCAAAIRSFKVK